MFFNSRSTAAAAATGAALLLGLAAPASAVDVECPDATASTVDCTNNFKLSAKNIKVGSTILYNIFGVDGHTQFSFTAPNPVPRSEP